MKRSDSQTPRRLPSAFAALAAMVAGGVFVPFGTPWSLGSPALAQSQSAPHQSAPQSAPAAPICTPRPGQLGVARVVEIDTTRGPRFGQQQYRDHDFLRDNEVVLTFDDGPSRRHSRMVLDALAAHCTQATFFIVGQMAVTDPEMVREIARSGHTIAIHTWSHRNLRAIGPAKAQHEIELGISSVQRALGRPVAPFFRFPYLADSPQMLSHLSERNFGVFSIDVDSRDFRTHDGRTMQRTVMQVLSAKPKGILLFHDIQTSTAHGIRGLLDELASKGFRVVHMVPKTTAVTQPGFDALAEAEFTRRNKIAAANPMAPRSVVWPMSAPGVPVERYRPEADTGAFQATRPPVRAPTRPGVTPAAATAPVPPQPAAAATQQSLPQGGAAPEERPPLRGTREDDDWRRNIFQQ